MQHSDRRKFLKTTTGALALAYIGVSLDIIKDPLLLSFSTLGCPDWDFQKIVDFASLNKYNGIEFRGIKRQLDLTLCPEFSPKNIQNTIDIMVGNNLKFTDLGSSCSLHYAEPKERLKNLDEGRKFIDLAQKMHCPYIRVFPNNLPKDQERERTIELIIQGLLELGEYAKGKGVIVLMESHGELVYLDLLEKIMRSAEHPNVGMVWDIVNMWSITKEPPAKVYSKLKKYIRHTHIKDLIMVNGKEHYTLLGKGETPIFDAIDILHRNKYNGYYSFEWEKLWHPEIDEPEIALADYPLAMRAHFK